MEIRAKGKNRMKTRSQLLSIIRSLLPPKCFYKHSLQALLQTAFLTLTMENALTWNAQSLNVLLSCMLYLTGRQQVLHAWNSNFQCWNMETGFLNKVLIKHNLTFIWELLRYKRILYHLQGTERNSHFLRLIWVKMWIIGGFSFIWWKWREFPS